MFTYLTDFFSISVFMALLCSYNSLHCSEKALHKFSETVTKVSTYFGPQRLCAFVLLLCDSMSDVILMSFQMTKMLHVFLVLALLGLGSGEEGARLLASKSLLNRYAVEGRDLTLQYNIYNVGSRSGLN